MLHSQFSWLFSSTSGYSKTVIPIRADAMNKEQEMLEL